MEKENSYNYSGFSAFKDLSKVDLRYIKGSYSIEPSVIHLVYDTSRIGQVRLPMPHTGRVSFYNSIMRVDINGSFSQDSIFDNALAISYLIRGCPSLIPIEVRLADPVLYPILKCYDGDAWAIRDAIDALNGAGVWIYVKKE